MAPVGDEKSRGGQGYVHSVVVELGREDAALLVRVCQARDPLTHLQKLCTELEKFRLVQLDETAAARLP